MSDLTEALEALLTVEPSDRASAIEQLARVHSRAAVLSLGAILYSQPAENLTEEKRRAIKTLGRSVSVDAVDVLRGYMASTADLEATVMAVEAVA